MMKSIGVFIFHVIALALLIPAVIALLAIYIIDFFIEVIKKICAAILIVAALPFIAVYVLFLQEDETYIDTRGQ